MATIKFKITLVAHITFQLSSTDQNPFISLASPFPWPHRMPSIAPRDQPVSALCPHSDAPFTQDDFPHGPPEQPLLIHCSNLSSRITSLSSSHILCSCLSFSHVRQAPCQQRCCLNHLYVNSASSAAPLPVLSG